MWVVNDELHFKPNKVNEPVYKFRYREDKDGYLQSFKIDSKAEEGKGTGRKTEVAGIDPLTKQPIVGVATQGTKSAAASTEKKSSGTVLISLDDKPLPEKRIENETPLSTKADESGRIIPSPAPTQAQVRQSAAGKVKTAAIRSIEAEAVTIGLPYLKAKDSVTIENIGKKFSGN